jgi:hypothetical protein
MGTVTVPDLVGRGQADATTALQNIGLVVGKVTPITNSAPANSVIGTDPVAGTSVAVGSKVDLETSAGQAVTTGPAPPSEQVAVPNVFGLTKVSAAAALNRVNLKLGEITQQPNNSVPPGGVSSTDPLIGTLVDRGTAVKLEVSSGHERFWYQNLTVLIFAALGLGLLYSLYRFLNAGGGLDLKDLADVQTARGLITLLIAISTVGIAIILAISTIVIKEGDDGDKRFDRGKQVLSVLIGVLGTIVGFYFASPGNRPQEPNQGTTQTQGLSITSQELPPGVAKTKYIDTKLKTSGEVGTVTWSVSPDLPSGLNLDPATGTISGTPAESMAAKPFEFTVRDGSSKTASKKLTLVIK